MSIKIDDLIKKALPSSPRNTFERLFLEAHSRNRVKGLTLPPATPGPRKLPCNTRVEDRLLYSGKTRLMQKQRVRERAELEKLQELQQKPLINQRSRQLAQQKESRLQAQFKIEASTLPEAHNSNLRIIHKPEPREFVVPQCTSGIDLSKAVEYKRILDQRKAFAF